MKTPKTPIVPEGRLPEKIPARIAFLQEVSELLISSLRRNHENEFIGDVRGDDLPTCHSWLSSCAHLIRLLAPPNSQLADDCKRLMEDESVQGEVDHTAVLKMTGLLESMKQELDWGLLVNLEEIFAAEAFDDFLDYAARFHKANKKLEASVLASAVLEDTVKKVCKKHNLTTADRSLEDQINDLVKTSVLTAVRAKRVKSSAGLRNSAFHARWEEFSIEDVGSMITSIRELIDEHLS